MAAAGRVGGAAPGGAAGACRGGSDGGAGTGCGSGGGAAVVAGSDSARCAEPQNGQKRGTPGSVSPQAGQGRGPAT